MFIASCKKGEKILPPEIVEPPPENQGSFNAFFHRHAPEEPLVQSVRQFVMGENQKYQFVDKLSAAVGFPIWDKALVYKKTNGPTVIYIPFARDNELYVDAALGAEITGSNIDVKMFYSWKYKDFDRSEKGWNGSDIFNVFTRLNNKVFGTTEFKLKDRSLANASIQKEIPAGVSNDSVDIIYTLTENPVSTQA